MADMEYIKNDMFTRFVPASDAGEIAWRQMFEQHGDPVVLNIHAQSVIGQLRRAGYSVTKAKPVTDAELDAIFEELEGL